MRAVEVTTKSNLENQTPDFNNEPSSPRFTSLATVTDTKGESDGRFPSEINLSSIPDFRSSTLTSKE